MSLGLIGKSGGGMGFLFGTGIGAVFVFLSGRGRGTPGGGRGCPRPITSGRVGVSSEEVSILSPLRCNAFQPHFFAVAAAFVTAAKDNLLVSAAVEDLLDDEVEFSRLGS